MDIVNVLPYVTGGLAIVKILLDSDNANLAAKAWNSVKSLFSGAEITQADIARVENELDALFDEFNAPLPA